MESVLPNHVELWPTPIHLARSRRLPAGVVQEAIEEARAIHNVDEEAQLTRRYGWSINKALRGLAAPGVVDADHLIARSICEALQTTGATRTGLGRVVTRHTTRLLARRQRPLLVRDEVEDVVVREATRDAERIRTELPAFARAVGAAVQQSAAALRERARVEHGGTVRLFRGVRGAEAPAALNLAGQHTYRMRPLASWSTSHEAADPFAQGTKGGAVLEALVPAGCIVIAPGFGESEVLLAPLRLEATEPTHHLHEMRIVRIHAPS